MTRDRSGCATSSRSGPEPRPVYNARTHELKATSLPLALRQARAISISVGVENEGSTCHRRPYDPSNPPSGKLRCNTYRLQRSHLVLHCVPHTEHGPTVGMEDMIMQKIRAHNCYGSRRNTTCSFNHMQVLQHYRQIAGTSYGLAVLCCFVLR